MVLVAILAVVVGFIAGLVVGWILRSQTVTLGDIAATELRTPRKE